MSTKNLPSRPNLEQYKKQAKDLLKEIQKSDASATMRVRASHPRYRDERSGIREFALADAQLVIAREHGFPSWTKFVSEIASISLRLLAEAEGPVYAFLVAASVPRGAWHSSGTLAQAEELLKQHPAIPGSSIYTAAVLADDIAVRRFLKADPSLTTAKGGPYGWDALTYLCFSRYLRLDKERSGGFLAAAKALLDAGANANTGWWEENTGEDRAFWESAIYGAAGVAQHAGLTKLLLERGANPNDEETPYHIPETKDESVLRVVLESGKMDAESMTTMLLRKADWHDREGMRMLLEAGADPNRLTRWRNTPLHQAIRRDNAVENIELMLQYGADFSVVTTRDNMTAFALAARRGRGDVLRLLIRGRTTKARRCGTADRRMRAGG